MDFNLDKASILTEAANTDWNLINEVNVSDTMEKIADILESFNTVPRFRYTTEMVPVIKISECDEGDDDSDDAGESADEVIELLDSLIDGIDDAAGELETDDESVPMDDYKTNIEELEEKANYKVEYNMLKKIALAEKCSVKEAKKKVCDDNDVSEDDVVTANEHFKYGLEMVPVFEKSVDLDTNYFIEATQFNKLVSYYTETFGYCDIEDTFIKLCESNNIKPEDTVLVFESKKKMNKKLNVLKSKIDNEKNLKKKNTLLEALRITKSTLHIVKESSIINAAIIG